MSVFVMSGVILTFVIALSSLLLVPKWGIDGYLISQLIGFSASISYTLFSSTEICHERKKVLNTMVIIEGKRLETAKIPTKSVEW